jgi:antitoxin HicB
VRLLNEMIAQEVTPSELARRLNTRPQDVDRIVDPHHTTKIDTVAAALKAPGMPLQVSAA